MDETLRRPDFCISYIDDILVSSESPELLFERLNSCGLVINIARRILDVQEVEFLGYAINKGGIASLT